MLEKISRVESLISETQAQIIATDTKASFALAASALFTLLRVSEEPFFAILAKLLAAITFVFAFLCIAPRTGAARGEISPSSIRKQNDLDAIESLTDEKFALGRSKHLLSLVRIIAIKRRYLRISLLLLFALAAFNFIILFFNSAVIFPR
ncbi:MAG: hypothetical protein AAFX54_17655 [Pseudomonadota bacterium]